MRPRSYSTQIAIVAAMCGIATCFSIPTPYDGAAAEIVSPVVDKIVNDQLQQTGVSDVLIQLRLPVSFTPEGYLNPAQVTAQRAAIAAAQRAIVEKLGGNAPHVRLLRYIPYMGLRINSAILTSLKMFPEVSGITADWPSTAQLDKTMPRIGAEAVRRALTKAGVNPTGPGVDASGQRWAVAVLDDGVERDHPFLTNRVIEEACFSIDTDDVVSTDPLFQIAQAFWDVVEAHSTCPRGGAREVGPGSAQPCSESVPHPDGSSVSICSHGTAVAGVAAGDGKSLPAGGALHPPDAGAAHGAAIVAMQIGHIAACANDWSQPCVGFRDTEALAALEHVHRLTLPPPEGKGLRIAAVNYSIGGPGRDEICDEYVTDIYDRRGRPFKAMIDTLVSLGIAFVASAGNNGTVIRRRIAFPACISSAISVGWTITDALEHEDVAAHSHVAPFMSFLAPGDAVVTSAPGKRLTMWGGGSSGAAPHVSGAFAVLKAIKPSASVDEITAALRSTALMLRDVTTRLLVPRIQLDAAAEALLQTPLPPSEFRHLSHDEFSIKMAWNDNARGEAYYVLAATEVGPPVPIPITVTIPANAQDGTVGGLARGTRYRLKVSACNAQQRCSSSATMEVTTEDSRPFPPTNLRVTTVPHSFPMMVDFTWTPGAWNPLSRPHCRVQLRLTGPQATDQQETACNASARFVVQPLTNYSLLVRACAYNALPPSAEIPVCSDYQPMSFQTGDYTPVGTPPAAPAAPTNLREVVCPLCIPVRLSWLDNSTSETRFELEWTRQPPPRPGVPAFPRQWSTITIPANTTGFTFGSTGSSGLHYLRIRACNTQCSIYSNEILVTVP